MSLGTSTASCKEYEGMVNMYQWVWLSEDTSGAAYEIASKHFVCTYGLHSKPMCPRAMCKDEEC